MREVVNFKVFKIKLHCMAKLIASVKLNVNFFSIYNQLPISPFHNIISCHHSVIKHAIINLTGTERQQKTQNLINERVC